MQLENNSLAEAVINDKPLLNIVYVPQIFQTARETFGKDYLFTVTVSDGISVSQQIPYELMKPPIVYISLGSIISNKGFYKKCIRAFGGKDVSVILNTASVFPVFVRKWQDS